MSCGVVSYLERLKKKRRRKTFVGNNVGLLRAFA